MAKARGGEVGDWSESGTFLRKPANGWLHDDRDLMNPGISYKIQYLGCVEVKNSMRTLQYQTRIQVTKEAITRLAENAQRIVTNKKRKLPKQLQKLLGETDTHWASEVNLTVSVESLRICAKSNREIMNHSLPSISFASGGDEATANFIGYVAKDPIHERACHVFECEDSQYVLTTIGQAFELRYKMYLLNPQDSVPRASGGTEKSASPMIEPPPPAPPAAPRRGAEQLRTPASSNPPLSKPRPNGNLPASPAAPPKMAHVTAQVKQLNIYDSTQESGSTETSDYSNPGEITDTHQTDDYVPDTTFKTVRQMGPRDDDNIDLTPSGIDLTPPDEFQPPSERLAIYANTIEVNGNGAFPSDGGLAIYANTLEKGSSLFDNSSSIGSSKPSYDEFSVPLAEGVYDDPNTALDTVPPRGKVGIAPPQNPSPNSSEGSRPLPRPRITKVESNPIIAQKVPSPPAPRKTANPSVGQKVPSPVMAQPVPKFDDTIYAKRVESPAGPAGLMPVPMSQQVKKMKYFHGTVSRVEAEALLEQDGDFLVRESGKQPGQYVLTGMGGGKPQHLLLIDKQGKVKSRDREFENIPHLVDHFMNLKTPLIIGDSEVFLKRPVINSFQNT